jgi:hypothetical protein
MAGPRPFHSSASTELHEPVSVQDLVLQSDAGLYSILKQSEQEFLQLVRENPRSILEQHRVYSVIKERLVQSFSLYITRPSTLEAVQAKDIHKRLWKCIKNELKAAEAAKRGDSRAAFDRLILQDKDLLTTLIKQLTESHRPLVQPNLPDCTSRRALGLLLMGIGEIMKLK